MNTFGIDWSSPDTWRGFIRIVQALMLGAGVQFEFTEQQIVAIVAVGQALNGIIGLFWTPAKELPKPEG